MQVSSRRGGGRARGGAEAWQTDIVAAGKARSGNSCAASTRGVLEVAAAVSGALGSPSEASQPQGARSKLAARDSDPWWQQQP
ncbi:MAG: hypothetical protein OEZ06_29620 [Myxococcales bacterium]|nr:hypothetical protein [Myxococcales bacterium]